MKAFLSSFRLRGPQGFLSIRESLGTPLKIVLGAIPIVLIFLGWHLATAGAAEERLISPTILPSPGEVIRSFPSLWFQAELSRSALTSALRVVIGFGVAWVIAFPLGIFMGAFTKVGATFSPVMVFLGYLPIPALVPLTMSLFGVDELQKVMFLALAFFIYLLPLFVRAVSDVDNVFLQTAYTLGATRWQTLRRVLLPVALPRIVHAMRLGFGVGWTYIILAEMVAAERGLGNIIIVAQRRGPREHIYLVLVVIVMIAYLTDKFWVVLSRYLFPYQEAR
ncbi:MAG TPA: ABC transporter permease [Acidobacteriota bacterium]|nr:ABC transporter permease [Acidobacteriota bacterium]HQG91904.1 ABC transporter permease [Acidobacteriota bacterium]